MNNYSFYQSSAQAPATYYICGSNDNSTWYPLIKAVATQVTGQTSVYTIPSGATSTSGTVSNITYNSYGYGSNAYTYFRLVITNLTSCTDGRAFFYEWTPAFTPATTSSVSLALDNVVPNQLNIGGSLSIAGGITPLYSTPSFGLGLIGYRYITTTLGNPAANGSPSTGSIIAQTPVALPVGVYLVNWAFTSTSSASTFCTFWVQFGSTTMGSTIVANGNGTYNYANGSIAEYNTASQVIALYGVAPGNTWSANRGFFNVVQIA
jgi:hypothetical protein